MRILATAAMVAASLLSACGTSRVDGVIQLGIERLGSDAASRSGNHNYRTAVNVTGVSLPYSVGSIVTNPGGTLPELLAVPQSYGCSKIIETHYYSEATPEQVSSVSRAIDRIAAALAAQSSVNLRLAILDAAVERADAIRAGESDAAKAAAAIEEDRGIVAAKRALGMSDFTAAQISVARTTLRDQMATARATQATAATDLQTLRAIPNLVVFRWSGSEARRAGLNVGAIFGFDSRSEQNRSGYIVMANVRTAALSPGADFAWATEFARRHPEHVERAFGGRYVTTFTLAAQHIAFAEDRDWSQMLRAELNLSPAEVTLLLGGDVGRLLSQQSVDLEAAMTSILSASSQGLISNPWRSIYEFRMTSVEARQMSALEEARRGDGFSVVYSSRSTIEDAARSTSGAARPSAEYISSPVVWRCMHSITARSLNGGFREQPPLVVAGARASDVTLTGMPDTAASTDGASPPMTVTNSAGETVTPFRVDPDRIYFCRPEYSEYRANPFGLPQTTRISRARERPSTSNAWLQRVPADGVSNQCIDLRQRVQDGSIDRK